MQWYRGSPQEHSFSLGAWASGAGPAPVGVVKPLMKSSATSCRGECGVEKGFSGRPQESALDVGSGVSCSSLSSGGPQGSSVASDGWLWRLE